MARKDQNNQFAVAQGIADHIFVDTTKGTDGTVISASAGSGNFGILHQYNGDNTGSGVALGAAGLTVVGGGEAATNLFDAIKKGIAPTQLTALGGDLGPQTEAAVIVSDGALALASGYQNGGASGYWWGITTNGNLVKVGASGVGAQVALQKETLTLKGKVTNGIDIHSITDTGIYDVSNVIVTNGPNASNGAGGVRYAQLKVLNLSGFVSHEWLNSDSTIYIEAYSGNPAKWGKWKQITTVDQ